jgi:hypothetical protein
MLARHFLIGLIALLAVPSVHAQQAQRDPWQPNPWRSLLVADHLSEEITGMEVAEIGMDGIPRYLSVDPRGHVGTVGKLAGMTIQVWPLRADGTTVTQQETLPCGGDCSHGVPSVDSRRFTFAPVPAKELVGVVVSENGGLYVREIKPNQAR